MQCDKAIRIEVQPGWHLVHSSKDRVALEKIMALLQKANPQNKYQIVSSAFFPVKLNGEIQIMQQAGASILIKATSC